MAPTFPRTSRSMSASGGSLGSISRRGTAPRTGRRRRLQWSFHPRDERDLVDEVAGYWESRGIKASVSDEANLDGSLGVVTSARGVVDAMSSGRAVTPTTIGSPIWSGTPRSPISARCSRRFGAVTDRGRSSPAGRASCSSMGRSAERSPTACSDCWERSGSSLDSRSGGRRNRPLTPTGSSSRAHTRLSSCSS